MNTSWHSYPSIYALGHRYLEELLLDPVLVEEKVDGSQFSFGVFEHPEGPELRCKSKGAAGFVGTHILMVEELRC